jgi:homoserine O-acetyltransferase
VSPEENRSLDPAAHPCHGIAQTCPVGGGSRWKRRSRQALLPERQIVPKHVETGGAQDLGDRHQQRRAAVPARPVRQDESHSRGIFRNMFEFVHRIDFYHRLLLSAILAALPLAAADYPEPRPGDFVMRDFRFASGETLPELRIHYRTLGEPRRNGRGIVTNAVLLMHGTTGSGDGFLSGRFGGVLFGKGQLLDAARYFIVLPDGIGHGASSKPSDGLHAKFPRYTYADMVEAQHRLVVEGLHVNHLRLVAGTSMGGMHTWMWGVRWPDFMDALMPLASAPVEIAGRNRMIRRMISMSIRDDPEWKDGEYTAPPHGFDAALHMLFVMLSSPLYEHREAATRSEADRYIEDWIAGERRAIDANDMLYAFEASRDYDPSPDLEKIVAPLYAINSADDEVNPPELGIMEREIARIPKGRYILIPTSPETRGHSTHSLPEIWSRYLGELLEASAGR